MATLLKDTDLDTVMASLTETNQTFAARYPGIEFTRLPIHTLYGGAHLFKKETLAKLTGLAQNHLTSFAPDPSAFVEALQIDADWIAEAVYERVQKKLQSEAIEDQRLDFEDGYGIHADNEEDRHAIQAANELAAAAQGLLNFFANGINSGAFTVDEALQTGISLEELNGRSFQQIVACSFFCRNTAQHS